MNRQSDIAQSGKAEMHNCVGCHSSEFIPTVHLGSFALSGKFPKINETVATESLELITCCNCGLTQLSRMLSGELLYSKGYGYESSLNDSMAKHLKNKARQLQKDYCSNPAATFVDIASNDGTLLSGYSGENLRLIGIDPLISNFQSQYNARCTKIEDFFSANVYFREVKESADIVTSCSVLYDSNSPRKFVSDVAKILKVDGIWHSEQSYLPTMVKNLSYDTICHEHLLYLRVTDVFNWCKEVGLEIIEIEENDVNGGSFAFTAIKKESPGKVKVSRKVQEYLDSEDALGYTPSGSALKEFESKIIQHRELLQRCLQELIEEGTSIYGIGASTKGNVLLQYVNLGFPTIQAIGDINPKKHGLVTPGTRIPIFSEEEVIMKADANSVFLVLPWHFKEAIVDSIRKKYPNRKIRLLFPLPKINFVDV